MWVNIYLYDHHACVVVVALPPGGLLEQLQGVQHVVLRGETVGALVEHGAVQRLGEVAEVQPQVGPERVQGRRRGRRATVSAVFPATRCNRHGR